MDINELRGLLEPSAQDKQDALSMGLLNLGSGLLANSTGHYGQFAPAWGRGLQAGMQGYQGGLQQARESRFNDLNLRMKLEDVQRKQEQDRRTQEMLGTLTPEQQKIYALGGGDALAKTLIPQTLQPSDVLAREKFEWEKKQKNREGTGVKPQFNENLGGFIEPPSPQFPQGRVIPVPGIKPKSNIKTALSPTAQKELFEADDTIQAAVNVQNVLSEALKINDMAYSGYGAKTRAVARSNLPGESQAADATINLDNMMTGQALESLKLIFGGMPTEGERKILLDMQASADKTPGQRKDIINRAIQAAKRREIVNANKAKSLREGTYFSENPQEQVTSQPVGSTGNATVRKFNPTTGRIE